MFDIVLQPVTGTRRKKLGQETAHTVICIMKYALQPRRIDRLVKLVASLICSCVHLLPI